MSKLPSFQFYPGDWMKDPALRSVSISARGLWIDMLCLMFESEQRGWLMLNGKPISEQQLARMTGCLPDEVSRYVQELREAGVFSESEHGCIYSRRLLRDAEIRSIRAKCGKLGGNPQLLNQPQSKYEASINQSIKQNDPPSSSPSASFSKKEPPYPPEGGMV